MVDKKEVKPTIEKEDKDSSFMDDEIKTNYTTLKDKVKLVMDQLHDLATMEVLLSPDVRMRNRLESIRKMSSADSIKVDGHWKTRAPKIHIINLSGRKISNEECEIRFGVFDMDDKGNKKLYEHYAYVTLADGSQIKRCLNAEYKVAYEVIETIKRRKPIEREIVRILEDKK